jgi:dynein light intermediate chain
MSKDQFISETLVNYSNIHTSITKHQKLDQTKLQFKNPIANLPFNKEASKKAIIKNASSLSSSNNTDNSDSKKFSSEQIEILNQLLPPRQYYDAEKKVYYMQNVCLTPATRKDVYSLNEKLNLYLQKFNARDIGLCSVRRKYYKECFDEIIRQVCIDCVERGIILSRIKDEINQTIDTYKLLYTSATAFGMRKILLNEDKSKNLCFDMEKYKNEIRVLNMKLEEEKMLRMQAERQLAEQESTHNDRIKEINISHNLVVHELKSQIVLLTSKSIQQLKNS